MTHTAGTPHAILIRAIKPIHSLETMLARRGKSQITPSLTAGPGTVTEALGIRTHHSGVSLTGDQIWLEDHGIRPSHIERTPRIGVDYAEEHKDLPYRFVAHGC